MLDPDEADLAASRLAAALERISAVQVQANLDEPGPRVDPRIAAKLDNLIRALRSALDS